MNFAFNELMDPDLFLINPLKVQPIDHGKAARRADTPKLCVHPTEY